MPSMAPVLAGEERARVPPRLVLDVRPPGRRVGRGGALRLPLEPPLVDRVVGWVGLFIKGFAYQAFPRFWQATLAAPRLAGGVFALMVAGVVLGTVGTAAATPIWALPMAMLGGILELLAIAILARQIVATFRRRGARFEPAVGFIMMALAWFLASTVFGLWHVWNPLAARSPEELLWAVATYQAPLRDLQIHGLALFMILGVALTLFPVLYDLPPIGTRRAWRALALLTAAVGGEVVLFLGYRWTGRYILAALLIVPWSLLVAGAASVILPWRPWRPFPTGDRSAKYVRASFAWLAVSLAMRWLLPVYLRLAGVPFSHAYYGAVRHAITVGFVSLMIMGVASRVIPTPGGIDSRTLPALWGPFLLVNAGCFLRLTTQTLTDWTGVAFPVIGLSGTLEVAGLAWWSVGLVRIMLRGVEAESLGLPSPIAGASRVEAKQVVADVLERFP